MIYSIGDSLVQKERNHKFEHRFIIVQEQRTIPIYHIIDTRKGVHNDLNGSRAIGWVLEAYVCRSCNLTWIRTVRELLNNNEDKISY